MDNSKFYIGAHVSISMGFTNALKSINSIQGNVAQIFLKSPRGRQSKPINEDDAKEAKKYLKENNMLLFGHSSYLLNFAKDSTFDAWPIFSLIDDLVKIEKLGGVGVVLHIGKYLKLEKKIAFQNIKKAVSKVIKAIPESVKILFENTAGQGTEIGFRIEELSEIYNLFSEEEKKQIGFCIDTCHAHSAGYDLSTEQGFNEFSQEFKKYIGWDKVKVIHLNDDKKEVSSRVDRHADLGYGTIGEEGLKNIVLFAKEKNIPLILETPTCNLSYKEQIQLVRNWVNSQ